MPVQDKPPYIAHIANGATSYTYNFRIFKDTDLVVTVAGVQKTLTTDYTVTGVGNDGGGEVVFTVPQTGGGTVEIERVLPLSRETDYQYAGGFREQTVDDDQDYQTMLIQQVQAGVARTVRVPTGAAGEALNLVDYANRFGKVLGWNSLGKFTTMAMNFVTSSGLLANPWADVRGYASLADAVAQLGGLSIELMISNVQAVSASLTIPANIRLVIKMGGMINISSGVTLTINGPFDAGLYTVFTGSGSVSLGVGSALEIPPQWWGAVGDGATDCTTAIQTALNVAHNSGVGAVYVPPGTYLTGGINWPGNNITLRGSSSGYSYNSAATPRTIFKAKAATTIVFDLAQTGLPEDRTGNHLSDFEINGNAIASVGIECAGSNLIERVRVRGCTTAGIRLANFTNGTRLVHCAMNQNSGWGLQSEGTSTTTYSVTDTNTSLNTLGGINLEAGVLVKFENVISESNSGPGLRIYKPNTHTNAMEGFDFINCWFEDNAATAPNYVLVIDSGTSNAVSGPQRVKFDQCRFTASVSTRKYANISVAQWVEFNRCQFDNSTEGGAITLSSNAHYIAFLNSARATGSTGLTAAQVDSAIAQGFKCWWYDDGLRRIVGAGAPAAGFLNGWVNYEAGFTPVGYWFDRDGTVCIEGQVKSGTIGTAVFTLPAGYRPLSQKAFACDGNGVHSLAYVTPTGEVSINVGSTAFQSLHGIRFRRD